MDFSHIETVLNELGNVHCPSGPIHSDIQKYKAASYMKENEPRAIHHLVEAHAPGFRFKSTLRYDKNLTVSEEKRNLSESEIMMPLNKDYVNLSCPTESGDEAVERLLGKLAEMPKEWTLVQLTSQFNPDKSSDLSGINLKFYTNGLFLTVFQCGPKAHKPFCVQIPAPTTLDGQPEELLQEMYDIQMTNKKRLLSLAGVKRFKNEQERKDYHSVMDNLNNRIEQVIKDTQHLWLGEWRYLFAGKLMDEDLEEEIENKLRKFISQKKPQEIFPEKFISILIAMIKNGHLFSIPTFKQILSHLLPSASAQNVLFRKDLCQFVRKLLTKELRQAKRHPVILILDDALDNIPWEQIDVLKNEPVSRVPSFHVAYALYKEHQASIVDGYKIVTDFKNGASVVNPGLDLKKMESRMKAFLKYWVPTWKAVIGKPPTEEQFEQMLTKSNIFTYSGHGTGTQYFSNLSIEKIRVNAVVFLFGCSSTALNFMSHQAEMFGTCQMYLMAACPCLIGMLWEVTDLDTDYLTTELMSMWVPSEANVHWKFIDKATWNLGTEIDIVPENLDNLYAFKDDARLHEPDLLRAVSQSKKSPNVRSLRTIAAMVVRGIPVKISC